MKIMRILLTLVLVCQPFCTGCWCWSRKCCNNYSHAKGNSMPAGCNECSNYGPEMFAAPVHGSAMSQGAGQPVDERLGNPAKQTPYEGPTKK